MFRFLDVFCVCVVVRTQCTVSCLLNASDECSDVWLWVLRVRLFVCAYVHERIWRFHWVCFNKISITKTLKGLNMCFFVLLSYFLQSLLVHAIKYKFLQCFLLFIQSLVHYNIGNVEWSQSIVLPSLAVNCQ